MGAVDVTDGWHPVPREAYVRLAKLLARSAFTAADVEHVFMATMLLFEHAQEPKADESRRVLGELARAFEDARTFKGKGHYVGAIAHVIEFIGPRAGSLLRSFAIELRGKPPELRTKIVRHWRAVGFRTADGTRSVKATHNALALLLLASGWRSDVDSFEDACASELAAVKAVDK